MSIIAIALYSFLLKKQNQNTQLYSKPYCSTMSSFAMQFWRYQHLVVPQNSTIQRFFIHYHYIKSNQEKKKKDSDMYLVNFLHQAQQVSNLFFLTWAVLFLWRAEKRMRFPFSLFSLDLHLLLRKVY